MAQNYIDNVDTEFLFYGHKYESFIMCVDAATDFLSTKRDPNHYSQDLTRYDKSCVESGKSYINNVEDNGNHTKPELKQIDIGQLSNHIQILDELITGKWLPYHIYRGLATNLVLIHGGVSIYKKSLATMLELYKDTVEFQQALQDNPNFIYRLKVLPTVINHYGKHYGYIPIDLQYFSPHSNDWTYINLLTPLSQVVRVEPYQGKPVDEVRQEFINKFNEVTTTPDTNIHVFRVATAIGKTELCTSLENVLLAFPDHALKDEVSTRMKVDHKVTPDTKDLPTEIKKKLDILYRIGAYSAANRFLGVSATNTTVKRYNVDMSACYNSNDTVLTTHNKALHYKEWQHTTIIFDEDPFKTILSNGKTTLTELRQLRNKMVDATVKDKLTHLINEIGQTDLNSHTPVDLSLFEDFEFIQKEVVDNCDNYSTNVLQFFQSSCYLIDKVENNIIHFGNRHKLPTDKKVIILSATVDEAIYRRLCGNRLRFYNFSDVQPTGVILQNATYSFSSSSLTEHLKDIDDISALIPTSSLPTITLAKHKKRLGELEVNIVDDMHFGKVSGYDELKGQDINVLGTFFINPIAIFLYAKLLDMSIDSYEFENQIVIHNGFRFRFSTYNNQDLRSIHFYIAQTELRQAIGRSRVNTERCKVYVYSNFPLPEACVTADEKALALDRLRRETDK
ncbi:hypothetical protein [Pseudanabaena yagii]|uniref:Uncharacterized protein n=1 Tax=Pseudanabaena yagii GIHE-NHR1 TaxID=2722753 RepID=A0ABX1LPQ0_9CYAN|nr:hypothetical protein [Pseudanabaena yagii]NMF57298.1 hypothetical protein [Pseudanabaena yagii GIHE-NHR1]